jgi:membrane protein DedA with SNARE-associated domain
MQLIDEFSRLILQFFHTNTFPALFVLILIEEAGVPIPVPGDTLVMFAGAAPHKTAWYVCAALAICSIAVFAGSSILFALMRRGGRPLLEKYGKYIHINERRLERLERWFVRRGPIALILGRLIPGLRIPTTVMAGLSGVSYAQYAPSAAIAAVAWSVIYFVLGIILGHEWQVITSFIAEVLDYVGGLALWIRVLLVFVSVIGGTWSVGWRVRHLRRKRRRETPTADHGGISTSSQR